MQFLDFLEQADLPRPRVNAVVELRGGPYEIDCVCSAARLAVELDSFTFPAHRLRFEQDRARDRALQAAGWRGVRVTSRHLDEEPEALRSELRTLLSLGADPR